jgi:hypothetical protein
MLYLTLTFPEPRENRKRRHRYRFGSKNPWTKKFIVKIVWEKLTYNQETHQQLEDLGTK